ncbi:MAG: DUF2141 domain-containing protein [Rhodospirillales bacterium]|nr:DUF2141 domain-containing protein [Rhodospirillales bacterium]
MAPARFRFFKYLAALAAIVFATPGDVGAETWQPLTLHVNGIEAGRGGQLQFFIFLKDGFPIKHDKALKTYIRPVSGSDITITVQVPADLPFALKVHHDEDANYKVSKNWTGIFPVEGFGFSAGAKMSMGTPKFPDARMTFPKNNTVTIPMRYP